MEDHPVFSRRHVAADASVKELRGDAPAFLVQALDAFAQADGISRTAYVNKVLLDHAKVRAHETSLAHRMLRGNPLYPDADRIPNPGGAEHEPI